jgi:GNAT superfamily N-acetyltransferase
MAGVIVREFERGDADVFRDLNVEWIERYFKLEQSDRDVLWHPQEAIIDKGGRILMAVLDRVPVGCCALVAIGDREYELSKMAVTPAERGHGIGRKLMTAAIEVAERLGARRLFLGHQQHSQERDCVVRVHGLRTPAAGACSARVLRTGERVHGAPGKCAHDHRLWTVIWAVRRSDNERTIR